MWMLARRAVAYAARTLEWEDFELPDVPPPGRLLVRTRATLISTGTELANWTGITADRKAMGADWHAKPLRLGYSLVGTVLAVGEGVPGWQPGARCSGAGPHASAAVLEASRCVPVPEGVSDAAATFGTLGPIALNGVRRAHLALGERVAVVGLGLIGQLAGLWARLAGARPVVGTEPIARRRDLAVALGFDAALDPRDDVAFQEGAAHWTEGQGFDVVFESTGHPSALVPALRLAMRDGRVVALGSTRGVVEEFDVYAEVHQRGVTMIGAHANTHPAQVNAANRWTEPANRAFTLQCIAAGDLPVERLISHQVAATQAPEMFRLLADHREEAMGVVLHWADA
jgi:L-iditol 2-dehydrogenase